MKLQIQCDWCGKTFERDAAFIKGKKHHFCCRQCLSDFSSKKMNPNGYASLKDYSKIGMHLSILNRIMNPSRMTPEIRAKLRESQLGRGKGKSYPKLLSYMVDMSIESLQSRFLGENCCQEK